MNFTSRAFALAGGLFAGLLLFQDIGRRIGRRRLAADPEGARADAGAVEGAVFGLLGLLLAFSFSGAAARFDGRRQLVVEEANAIGTAWLRLDLLPAESRARAQGLFRQYLDSRLATYRKLPDTAAAMEELANSNRLQQKIWNEAVAGSGQESAPPTRMLLLPALNQMIDITTTRTMATQMHPPGVIFAMLFLLALAGSLLAGYGMASSTRRNWIHLLGFAVTLAIAVYIILDLEYPRLGLIRVDRFDQVLVDLRQSMQ